MSPEKKLCPLKNQKIKGVSYRIEYRAGSGEEERAVSTESTVRKLRSAALLPDSDCPAEAKSTKYEYPPEPESTDYRRQ